MNTEQQLKSLTEDQKKKVVDQINTELTSIADQEKKTGTTIQVPQAEQLVALASASLLNMRRAANQLMLSKGMSKRGLIRAFNAILDLPTDGVPVFLQSDEEKKLFACGQRAISDRYVIITHHIKKAIAEDRLNKLQQQEGQKNGEATTEG